MHTPEQAQQLWCPMARVAQSGHADISASYNRTVQKSLRAVKATTIQSPDDFELGAEAAPEFEPTLIMQLTAGTSMAANCLGPKCAAWRWHHDAYHSVNEGKMVLGDGHGGELPAPGYCGLAGAPATNSAIQGIAQL